MRIFWCFFVCRTRPGFDRAESMLNRLPSRSHGIRSLIQSGLHRIQGVSSCSQRVTLRCGLAVGAGGGALLHCKSLIYQRKRPLSVCP